MSKYQPVIGLEVHVELKTQSKMFCSCRNDWFGKEPNTHTCPVCLGLPGALPVPNKKAIEWCVLIGIALNCEVPLLSKFDRKHYFYPDLPKGYQISQYDMPFAQHGHIVLSNGKKIRILRVHMEEDTGKLLHEKAKSWIDFNRSGVPLVEIVTAPDFETAQEVKEYLQKLQQIIRYLRVSDANMEKGEMRLEPNISLRLHTKKALPKYKAEVKNINSFSFVEKAINYELKRQEEILEKGETPKQETRGWDEKKGITVSQRSKENAMDYRYFPEPDIPPIRWGKKDVTTIKKHLPELPDAKKTRFIENFQLSSYNTEILTKDRQIADFFEEAVRVGQEHMLEARTIANVIINKKVATATTLPAQLIETIIKESTIEEIETSKLETAIQEVLDSNQKAVLDYKKGKENAIMFLVGQAMAKLKGKAKADEVREKIIVLIQ